MDNQTITTIKQGEKYEIQYEQSAVKGVIGFKVKAQGDDLELVKQEAFFLLVEALQKAKEVNPVTQIEGTK